MEHQNNQKNAPKTEDLRLNKYIAQCGLASRRHADTLIEEGKVTINGRRVYELGIRIDPRKDKVLVDGRPIQATHNHVYVIFNKPKNVLTAMSDPLDRPTVGEYFDRFPVRVFPVGRLDWESEGMLLLTNDGDFAEKVSHPRDEIEKTYLVKINGHLLPEHIEKLKKGVPTAVGRVRATQVERLRKGGGQYDWITISITEGRNRQIRRMMEKIGFDVMKLQRIAIGSLTMGSLKRGDFKVITPAMAKKVFTRTNS